MKKLMLIVAIALTAVASSAATIKWTAANIYGSDGNKWAGDVNLYAYLTSGSASDAFLVTTLTSSATGAVSSTLSSDLLVAGNDYSMYFTVDDAGKTFTSDAKGPFSMQPTGTTTVAFGNMQTATQNANNWKSGGEDVPEPTSGMLLLLGLAGLALRRKQA